MGKVAVYCHSQTSQVDTHHIGQSAIVAVAWSLISSRQIGTIRRWIILISI